MNIRTKIFLGSSSCQFLHYQNYSLGGGTLESFILCKPDLNLAQDIGQCPEKYQVMSSESCFTTDTVVRREFK